MITDIALLLATLSIMTGALVITGVPTKLGSLLVEAAGVNMAAMVAMAFIFGAILGTGLPPAPVYILVAIVIGPPFIKIGVNPWVVHFFAFFIGVFRRAHPANFHHRGHHGQDCKCIVLHHAVALGADLRVAVHAYGRRLRASRTGGETRP